MSEANFQLEPELTGIALAYRNKKYIADEIFHEVPVNKDFKYRLYAKGTFLTVPDTRIGETGSPNEINLKSNQLTDSCENHALKEKIAKEAIDDDAKKSKPTNIRSVTTVHLIDAMKGSREVSMARNLMNIKNYGNNYKILEDSEKINKNVDVVKFITDELDKVFYKPNTMVISRAAMSALKKNSYMLSACYKNDIKAGVASIDAIKDVFEVDNIYVGETIVNVSKNKDIPVLAACWTNDISFMYLDPIADTDYGMTFGYTARNEDLQVATYFDPDAGTKGCEIIKAFEVYKDMFVSPDCGFLFKGVI